MMNIKRKELDGGVELLRIGIFGYGHGKVGCFKHFNEVKVG